MIWEHESNIIVMLCNVIESGREKCANYWNKDEVKINNKIQILNEIKKKEYIIREILLSDNLSKKDKKVYQLHFIAWLIMEYQILKMVKFLMFSLKL